VSARPRHIGIEALSIVPGRTGGVETYTRGLLDGLLACDPALRLTLFVRRDAAGAGWPRDPRVQLATIDARPRMAELAPLLQTWLPWRARRLGIDVVHHVAWYGALATRLPTVVTIHDLITTCFYGRDVDGRRALRSRLRDGFLRLSARRASRVIVPSAAVRDELIAHFGVAAARVVVTHEAPKELGGAASADAAVLAGHGLRADDYVLAISRFLPHKNLERLISAHLRAAVPHPLVIAGVSDFPPHGRPVLERVRAEVAASPHRASIRFLGFVGDAELPALYRGARAFAWPSLAEGFGLPPLEAMRHHAPVLASDIAVHREVLGDGAGYFAATDTDALALALRRLCADDAERAHLRRRGAAQVARYSWTRTAAATLVAYTAAAHA
jgi:glycosyltransferase involved in cell wall biosynthesis